MPANQGLPASPVKNSVKGITNLADALFMLGKIDQDSLKSVKFESITTNTPIEQVIITKALVSDEVIQQTKAEMYGVGYVDVSNVTIDLKLLSRLSKEIAQRNMALVYEENASRVKVAMVDPLDLQKIKYLESLLAKKVDAYFASPSAIQRIVDTKYGAQINPRG